MDTKKGFIHRRLASFGYAIHGLRILFQTQFHAWVHLVATGVVIVAGLLSWSPVTAATHYEVWIDQIDAAGNQLQRQVVYQPDVQSTRFNPAGLGIGQYSFWVRAIRAEGGVEHVSFWSTQVDFQVSSATEDQSASELLMAELELTLLPAKVETESEADAEPPEPVRVPQTSEEDMVTAVMEELVGSDLLDRSEA